MAAKATSPRGKEAIVFNAVATGESLMRQCTASYLCPREWLLTKRRGHKAEPEANHESGMERRGKERWVGEVKRGRRDECVQKLCVKLS